MVGYKFACRFGERLGKSHYQASSPNYNLELTCEKPFHQKFHTTATAGIIGAASATSYLLHHDVSTMLSAIGTAGIQAAGLYQFLLDATHSKQVHTAKAASDGVLSAYLPGSGLLGPKDILEGDKE